MILHHRILQMHLAPNIINKQKY